MAAIANAPQSFRTMSITSRVRYNHVFRNTGAAGFATTSSTTTDKTAASSVPKPVLAVERSPSAFMLFRKDQLAAVKKETTSGNVAEALKKKWDSLASTKKEVYTKQAGAIAKELTQKRKHADEMREKLAEFLKPAPSAYLVFSKEKFAAVPGKTVAERIPKIAAQWKNLGANQKKKYVSEADAQRKKFEQRRSGLTEEQKNALAELRVERRMRKLERMGRLNRNKELGEFATKYGRPKKPLTGYGLLRAELWSSLGKGSVLLRTKSVAAKWNALQAGAKQRYLDNARPSMEQYKKDLAAWEEKMVKAGHKDMVEKFHKKNFRAFLPKNVKVPGDQRRKALMKLRVRAKKATMMKKLMARREQRKAKLEAMREKRKARMAAQKAKKEKRLAAKKAEMATLKAKRAPKKAKTTPKKGKQQKKGAMKKGKVAIKRSTGKGKKFIKSKAHTKQAKKAMPAKSIKKVAATKKVAKKTDKK